MGKLRTGLALCAALAASACAHNIYLMGRTTGEKGTARVISHGGGGGEINIELGGKTYTGRWVYAPMGGTIGFGTATAFSGAQTASATSTMIGAPTSGNGSVIASTPDGSTLHCSFDYSEWGASGVGICQDNKGEIYDLLID